MLGDFNARTGNDCDFIEGDNTNHIPLNNSNYNLDILNERRASCDNTVDSRGKDLLDFCICNQIRILNGRILGNSTGKHTCFKYNGCSVVDYVLASEQLFCNILYMCVSDFKATFSDCHCKLSFKLLASFTNENTNSNLKDFPTRYEWNEEKSISFQNAFAHPAIQNELKNFITEDINFDSAGINQATKTIHSLFEKVCKITLKKKKKRVKTDKKWFDHELTSLKKNVDGKAALMNKYPKDPFIRGSFFKTYKKYAKLRKYKKREFKNVILNRLENLETENPKEYWKLVNLLRNENTDKPENNIDGETWYKYFASLASIPIDKHDQIKKIEEKLKLLESNITSFTLLDNKISEAELNKAFKKLKSDKSPGLDNISNEMLKASQSFINTILLKLFNAVFTSGIYPSEWSKSFICPIFKADDRKKPENYRGIAINNSIGKLFNIILNNRFDLFLDENNIIHETQIGFSKKARTSDHIFVLRCIIEKYLKTGNKKLFACFVDFRKAFDKVIHIGIMYKLQLCNINNYFYRILKSMYTKDRLCVKINDKMTEFFVSGVGVRQGDVLSPNLFKFFINELPKILLEKSESVCLNNEKIPCLLYADDLVIFSESRAGLQDKLDILYNYCNEWCLEVNSQKTKIIIFNNNGHLIKDDFHIGEEKIDCVKQYKYLGLIIQNTGKFTEARKQLYQKSLKACFKLYRDLKSSKPSIGTFLHLFDHCIKPIILYGCENWGTINITPKRKSSSLFDIFKDWESEKLHHKFCKYILGVTKLCTNIGVLTELGRYPLYIDMLKQVFMYWHRLENSPSNLLNNAYKEYMHLHSLNKGNNSWYTNILFYGEKLNFNLAYCKTLSKYKFKKSLKQCLRNSFLETWKVTRDSYLQDKGKLSTYFKFKFSFGKETYLSSINNGNCRILTKFRLSNHKLRVETGRHERRVNMSGKLESIPRCERLCQYCNLNVTEDEHHFLLQCPLYVTSRTILLDDLFMEYPKLRILNSQNLFIWIMTNDNDNFIKKLCKFLTSNLEVRNNTVK